MIADLVPPLAEIECRKRLPTMKPWLLLPGESEEAKAAVQLGGRGMERKGAIGRNHGRATMHGC